ncbi:organic cation transporter protein-like [Lingula anatina]|uniref:Organic cation transporter protein-like n=1 Tax=Lingula anatina TaxID=7574 RepID=A0A1S3KBH2_LINAN|nr:organic cation transporter protein-like [Lingula anatina]|eukprot:XP_013419980.1 organic cation transporter protein-like [Lingula anatina]
MNFDDLLKILGELGTYQRQRYVLLCIVAVYSVTSTVGIVFYGIEPNHHCKIPSAYVDVVTSKYGNVSQEDLLNLTIPYTDKEGVITRLVHQVQHRVQKGECTALASMSRPSCQSLILVVRMHGKSVLAIQFSFLGNYYLCFSPAGCLTALELVGVSRRRIPAMGKGIFFGLGHVVMAAEAYFVRNWRHLALVANTPGVLFVCFWWFFPESVRWLLARGRHEEAEVIIKRVAKVNKAKLEQETVDRLFKEGEEDHRGATYTHIELFRTWRRAFITSIMALIWMVNMMCYYGLTLNAKGLGGSLYLSFALLGAADIPGLLAAAFCIDKLGRRKTIFGTICLGGSLCIASGLIPTSMFYLTIACAALGKMLITLSKAVLSMFLVESYPTVIRHMGLSFCSSVARLGAVITPQILFLGRVYRPLPFIIWGALAICTGFLILLVPETLNKPLLQTVEEWDVVLDRKILGCTSKKDGNEARDTTTTGESSYL